MELATAIQTRRSEHNLVDPAPSSDGFIQLLECAATASDYGRLRPWFFVPERIIGADGCPGDRQGNHVHSGALPARDTPSRPAGTVALTAAGGRDLLVVVTDGDWLGRLSFPRRYGEDVMGRGRQQVPGPNTGQLRWLARGVALLAGVVGVLVPAAPTAAASQDAILDGGTVVSLHALDRWVSQAPPLPPSAVNYVALGDSYSSGVGTGVYDPASGDCARSPLSYPALWTAEHHPPRFGFAACSGATTDDVLASQIPALQVETDLVTITIGGNDAGFAPVLETCTFAQSDNTCIGAVDAAEAYVRTVLPGRLTRTYTTIRRAAPRARVVVLGYPRLFDLAPSCSDPLVPNLTRRRKLNEGSDVLNTIIQKMVSQQPGFSFADVRGQFGGHGVCAADPWINGPSVPSSIRPYHPNQTGYREGYLDALDAVTSRGIAAA
jgi:lysophospholipase L1-like esterase